MEIKVSAFPVVYINTICTKHQCSVELRVGESKRFQTREVVGSQITALRCQTGGAPEDAGCHESWQLQILAGGEVTVGQ